MKKRIKATAPIGITLLIICLFGALFYFGEWNNNYEECIEGEPISDIIKNELLATKTINIKRVSYTDGIIETKDLKTITNKEEIDEIITIFSNSNKICFVRAIGLTRILELYDKENNLIDTVNISVYGGEYGLNIQLALSKGTFSLSEQDNATLLEILEYDLNTGQ